MIDKHCIQDTIQLMDDCVIQLTDVLTKITSPLIAQQFNSDQGHTEAIRQVQVLRDGLMAAKCAVNSDSTRVTTLEQRYARHI